MASWAAKLAGGVEDEKKETQLEVHREAQPVAILDANALISLGADAQSVSPVIASTEEVLKEIKDKNSRAVLSRLSIQLRAPSDEAVRAVVAFASSTGDLHQLSTEDVRLIALAYTYEVELHGQENIRTAPPAVRVQGGKASSRTLPGWGCNEKNAEWGAIDEYPDDETETTIKSFPTTTSTPAKAVFDDDGWEVARTSKNAARRAKRKAAKRLQRQEVAQLCTDEVENDGNSASGSVSDDSASAHDAKQEGSICSSGEDDEDGIVPGTDAGTAHDSMVSLVTSDFAMQNVALQMGLRLVTKGGQRIARLQRSVLRCEACGTIVTNQTKMFCPACGHATLSKVSLTVGPDGKTHVGVRKRFTLRGTRYSLPKPRGGRNSANPILSEDVYNSKVRKPKTRVAKSDDPLEALTYGDMKKHQGQSQRVAQGLYHLSTGPRNNPNERKHVSRSNRRR